MDAANLSRRLGLLASACWQTAMNVTEPAAAETLDAMGHRVMVIKRATDIMGDDLTLENVDSAEAFIAVTQQALDLFSGRKSSVATC